MPARPQLRIASTPNITPRIELITPHGSVIDISKNTASVTWTTSAGGIPTATVTIIDPTVELLSELGEVTIQYPGKPETPND